jgi:hypothetical protein
MHPSCQQGKKIFSKISISFQSLFVDFENAEGSLINSDILLEKELHQLCNLKADN